MIPGEEASQGVRPGQLQQWVYCGESTENRRVTQEPRAGWGEARGLSGFEGDVHFYSAFPHRSNTLFTPFDWKVKHM